MSTNQVPTESLGAKGGTGAGARNLNRNQPENPRCIACGSRPFFAPQDILLLSWARFFVHLM